MSANISNTRPDATNATLHPTWSIVKEVNEHLYDHILTPILIDGKVPSAFIHCLRKPIYTMEYLEFLSDELNKSGHNLFLSIPTATMRMGLDYGAAIALARVMNPLGVTYLTTARKLDQYKVLEKIKEAPSLLPNKDLSKITTPFKYPCDPTTKSPLSSKNAPQSFFQELDREVVDAELEGKATATIFIAPGVLANRLLDKIGTFLQETFNPYPSQAPAKLPIYTTHPDQIKEFSPDPSKNISPPPQEGEKPTFTALQNICLKIDHSLILRKTIPLKDNSNRSTFHLQTPIHPSFYQNTYPPFNFKTQPSVEKPILQKIKPEDPQKISNNLPLTRPQDSKSTSNWELNPYITTTTGGLAIGLIYQTTFDTEAAAQIIAKHGLQLTNPALSLLGTASQNIGITAVGAIAVNTAYQQLNYALASDQEQLQSWINLTKLNNKPFYKRIFYNITNPTNIFYDEIDALDEIADRTQKIHPQLSTLPEKFLNQSLRHVAQERKKEHLNSGEIYHLLNDPNTLTQWSTEKYTSLLENFQKEFKENNFRRAAVHLSELKSFYSDLPETHEALALNHIQKKEYSLALDELTQAKYLHTQWSGYSSNKSNVAEKLKVIQIETSRVAALQYQEDPSKGELFLQIAKKTFSLYPNDPKASEYYISALISKKDFNQALSIAISHNPDPNLIAMLATSSNSETWQKVCNDPKALSLIADYYISTNETDNAVFAIQKLLNLPNQTAEDHTNYLYRLIYCFQGQNNYNSIKSTLEKEALTAPLSIECQQLLASTYIHLNEPPKSNFFEVVKCPKSIQAIGAHFISQENYTQAIDFIKTAITCSQTEQDHQILLDQLIYCHYKQNNSDVIKNLLGGRDFDTINLGNKLILAQACLQLKDLPLAEKTLQHIIKNAPEDSNSPELKNEVAALSIQLLSAYRQSGEENKIKEFLEEAAPNNEYLRALNIQREIQRGLDQIDLAVSGTISFALGYKFADVVIQSIKNKRK